ncbi:transcription factor bHLH94 [Gossypium raimondii]|uniref:BHLH domain-containing protein n=1 Tax=Gossypium raimondii TaxID=29730 RepID=A0A0D2VI30_GOSRA|nr:transcription factor bHLH94 [Gossypium raimondii]KJB82609.1 hypothetical protein B456_013G204300 [Gossypium raimondii]MBA0603245.1 hypothetical protein [Gossypium raimondii]
MAMEAVIFQQDWFGYNGKDVLLGGNWSYGLGLGKEEEKFCFEHIPGNQTSDTNNLVDGDHRVSSSSQTSMAPPLPHSSGPSAMGRRKRRRSTKAPKNKEEMENQRMTHITVERNRRKQMNQYLSLLRSLMPPSYAQRGDQASIIGGAINFVKELEQRLQWLSGQKEVKEETPKFDDFFTSPQYSTPIGDIEVNVNERHANLKIRWKRRPSLLFRLVSGLNAMRLTILHLNVTTAALIVLYSLTLKVEDDCKLTTGDGIASAVNQLLCRNEGDDGDDAMFNSFNSILP